MKKYYFLCSLPRSGNTLLASIINQNKNITVTANSILPHLLFSFYKVQTETVYKNFPNKSSLQNVIKNIIPNYYNNWKSNIIIDRSTWGTPMNLYILYDIFKTNKFIILYRPVLECLASYIKILKPDNIEKTCEDLMSKEGTIGKDLWSIQNIIQTKQKYVVIHYRDLITDTENQIKKIYSFIKEPYKKINLNKLKQLKINNVEYDDSVLGIPNLHKIKTNKIEKSDYKIKDILPKKIINKYSGLDIL